MQKTLICLKRDEHDAKQWNHQLVTFIESKASQFIRCSYALRDEDVAPAHLLEMINTGHPCDALLSIWSENTFDHAAFFTQISSLGDYQAYGVLESAPLVNEQLVGRVPGMCQVAFIRKPQEQTRSDWLSAWLGDHTKVAIDTQSTFGYRQNIVATVMPYKSAQYHPSWPLMDAIVEENFPALAMTSREAFFAAEGDAEKFEKHQQIMMQSCGRFIDFSAFDCVPMSQYLVKV